MIGERLEDVTKTISKPNLEMAHNCDILFYRVISIITKKI